MKKGAQNCAPQLNQNSFIRTYTVLRKRDALLRALVSDILLHMLDHRFNTLRRLLRSLRANRAFSQDKLIFDTVHDFRICIIIDTVNIREPAFREGSLFNLRNYHTVNQHPIYMMYFVNKLPVMPRDQIFTQTTRGSEQSQGAHHVIAADIALYRKRSGEALLAVTSSEQIVGGNIIKIGRLDNKIQAAFSYSVLIVRQKRL